MSQFRTLNPLAQLAGLQGAVSQGQAIRGQRQGNQLREMLMPLQVQEAQNSLDMQGRKMADDDRAQAMQMLGLLGQAIGNDFEQLAPEEQQARYMAGVQAVGQAGFDVSDAPQGMTTDSLRLVRFAQSQLGDGGLSADYRSFQQMTSGLTPEEKERARRIELGLDPRATGSAALTIADSGRTQDVADSEATITGAKSGAAEGAKLDEQIRAAQDKAFQEILGQEGGKIYSDLQRAAQQASEFMPRLRGLKEMAAAANTGAYAKAKMMGKRVFGLDVATDEALNAKLMGLAQDILNQQTGTKTDFDFQVAVEQAASMGKSPEANVMLINSLISRQESALRFGDMAREAMQAGGPQAVLDLRFTPGASDVGADADGQSGDASGALSGSQSKRLQELRAKRERGEL